MKRRSPVAVLLLPFVTFGIYSFVWQILTKIEMNKSGAKIPTAWLYIIPFVNIWWLWKYSEGVEEYTNGKTSKVVAFILLFLLGFIGQAIVQASFNEVTPTVAAAAPAAPAPAPENTDTTPPAAPTPPTPPTPPVVQ